MRAKPLAVQFGFLTFVLVLIWFSLREGPVGPMDAGEVGRGFQDLFRGAPSLHQAVFELRLWKALTAAGVGGALALAGALLQGLVRNPLASPGLIGTSAGASVGASAMILMLGGSASKLLPGTLAGSSLAFLVALGAFLGALAATLVVVLLAGRRGRLTLSSLLLCGIAMNATLGGLLALLQALALRDYELSRALFAWTFGILDDRSAGHAALIWATLAVSAMVLPFLVREMDLLRFGEEDAMAVGVSVERVKFTALGLASLLTASAVAVAGQIAFLGLMAPHIMRLLVGGRHRDLLPAALLGGAAFLLMADLIPRYLLDDSALRPGVVMSLLGGPFFLVLLFRRP